MGLFCEKAKAELKEAKLFNDRQRFSMLSALVRALGTIELFKGGKRLNLRLDNPVCKDTFFDLMNRLYKDFPFHNFSKSLISIEGGFLEKLLMDLRIFKKGADGGNEFIPGIDKEFISDAKSRFSYIRGLFLGSGAVTVTSGYHLEFSLASQALAGDLVNLLVNETEDSSCVKTMRRNDKTVVYIKDSQAVSDILAILGAEGAVLELNNIQAARAAEQLTNRRFNCDIANIDKTLSLSQRQIVAITVLDHNKKLDGLSPALKEAALARLKNPEASLEELADILGITKSGVRHRLEKLVLAAESV